MDEKKQYYDTEEEDCTQEAFINPNNKTRRKAIYTTSNSDDDIIKCIGSLRIEYDDKNILTNPPETAIGTGTIIRIGAGNLCYVLTAAHNACQPLKKCNSCNKQTIASYCTKCNQQTSKLKPVKLIKPTSVEFIRRCTVSKRVDNKGREYTFGDPERTYEVDACYFMEAQYNVCISPMAGYDIAIMMFKCKNNNEIKMYQNICSRIRVKCDPTFGGNKNRLFIYGYPFDKYNIKHNMRQYQMYGMSTGINGNTFKIDKHYKSNKQYIINNQIDTQAGQSGSCIWSYDGVNTNVYNIYGVHSGGNPANVNKGRNFGVNYGTFLDEQNLNWIKVFSLSELERQKLGNEYQLKKIRLEKIMEKLKKMPSHLDWEEIDKEAEKRAKKEMAKEIEGQKKSCTIM